MYADKDVLRESVDNIFHHNRQFRISVGRMDDDTLCAGGYIDYVDECE
jgi:hypothetical protein